METHKKALKSVLTLHKYCMERFDHERGMRGCRNCIFQKNQKCILGNIFLGYTEFLDDAKKRCKELSNK